MTCSAPGWGTGPFGTSPWAGGLGATPGGAIPTVPPYDIYCVGPCGPMSVILTFDEVDEVGDANQLTFENTTQDLLMVSGGSLSSDDTYVTITTGVPAIFTHEYTVKFNVLPTNFVDVVNRHILIGTFNAAGASVSLLFSRTGIAYSGGASITGGDLVLESSFQPLPNSQTMITEGEYYTFRIAVDGNSNIVYIYITKTADLPSIGHQLKFILPTIDSLFVSDGTLISVRGTLGSPSSLSLDTMCMSSQFIVPNIPPVADAGMDQAVLLCSVSRLDGSKSFDPEGTNITFSWRLLDAPVGSSFMYDGGVGHTEPLPMPTGFTNKFYSDELNDLDAIDELVAGEVLSVGGVSYTVTGKGTDGSGFHVTVEGFILPDNLSLPYKYLRQRGLSGKTLAKPTFLADKPGIYRFDLVVSDGFLLSEPSITILNVTESPVPRGCIPDLRFLWDYLSDFWKLVEDKERIEVFWGSLAQVAASELLNIWQTEYSKSIRDVQRTAQRRWLQYDTLVKEPLPDLTTVDAPLATLVSDAFGNGNYNGLVLELLIINEPEAVPTPLTVTVLGENPMTPTQVAAQVQGSLRRFDSRFTVEAEERNDGDFHIAIASPYNLIVELGTTLPMFDYGTHSGYGGRTLSSWGTDASILGPFTFQTQVPLIGQIYVGRYLVLDGIGYKIRSVIRNPSDDVPFSRIITAEQLPTTFTEWSIGGEVTSTELDFYEELFVTNDDVTLEISDSETGTVAFKKVKVLGVYPGDHNILLVNLDNISAELGDTVRFTTVLSTLTRRTYIPVDDVVVDIPLLQEKIKDPPEAEILRRNVDFLIEDDVRGRRAIHFATSSHPIDASQGDVWYVDDEDNPLPPPDRLWAEITYLDNRNVIEQNFGIPAEFTLDDLATLPSSVDYLSAVRGLWYAYFKGPTLFNLRVGTQILLGLPFAEEPGTITEIRTDYSPNQGRILIQDTANPEITRSYTFPLPLELEENPDTGAAYKLGDTVRQFAPLVTGAEVVDYIKDPNWFEGFLNQGLMFEVEKFFKFLTRVDSAAFNLNALLFVKTFILRIKPTYTFPYFVVLRTVDETEVNTTDEVTMSGGLYLYDGTCFQNNAVTTWGVATMWDEPDPSSGGWQSQYDSGSLPSLPAPTWPVPQSVNWGFDRNLLCPEDYILATASITYAVDTVPTFDSLFAFDLELFQGLPDATLVFEDSDVLHPVAPGGGPITLYGTTTLAAPKNLTDIEVVFDGYKALSPGEEYTFEVLQNGIVVVTVLVTPTDGRYVFQQTISASLLAADVISVRFSATVPAGQSCHWETVMVKLGASVPWLFDTTIPAGTYSIHRDL